MATSESTLNPGTRKRAATVRIDCALGEALIIAAGAFAQPVPLLPSAGEIDAAIERKLHEWDLARAARVRS